MLGTQEGVTGSPDGCRAGGQHTPQHESQVIPVCQALFDTTMLLPKNKKKLQSNTCFLGLLSARQAPVSHSLGLYPEPLAADEMWSLMSLGLVYHTVIATWQLF